VDGVLRAPSMMTPFLAGNLWSRNAG